MGIYLNPGSYDSHVLFDDKAITRTEGYPILDAGEFAEFTGFTEKTKKHSCLIERV